MKKTLLTLLLIGTMFCGLAACDAPKQANADMDTPVSTKAPTKAPTATPTEVLTATPSASATKQDAADYTTDVTGWFYQPETEDPFFLLLNTIGARKYGTAGASLSRESASEALMELSRTGLSDESLRSYLSGMSATQADFFSFQWQMAMKDALVSDSVIAMDELITALLSEFKVSDVWKENPELEPFTEWTEGKTILPLPVTFDSESMDDCTLAVSFEQGDAYVDDAGIMRLKVKVYTYDLYDMVDIARMEEGDTILLRGEEVVITSLTRTPTGAVEINGGLDNGGYELSASGESTVFFEIGYSDVKAYYELSEAVLRVSTEFVFYDNMDLDKGEVIYYPGDFLTDGADILYYFTPNNTTIIIEDGQIIAMNRAYTP